MFTYIDIHILIFSKYVLTKIEMTRKHLNLIINHRGKIFLQVRHYSGLCEHIKCKHINIIKIIFLKLFILGNKYS